MNEFLAKALTTMAMVGACLIGAAGIGGAIAIWAVSQFIDRLFR